MSDSAPESEAATLRRFLPGRLLESVVPWRVRLQAESLASDGRLRRGRTDDGRKFIALTDAGMGWLADLEGPLTDAEQEKWLSYRGTRVSHDGYGLRLQRVGTRRYAPPKVRQLLTHWSRHPHLAPPKRGEDE